MHERQRQSDPDTLPLLLGSNRALLGRDQSRQKLLNRCGASSCVARGVLNVSVTEVSLKRAGVVPVIAAHAAPFHARDDRGATGLGLWPSARPFGRRG